MTGNEYQELAARTINWKLSQNEKRLHALHGISSEVGEIHSIFQKSYQGHEVNSDHLKKELGDLMWFTAEFCTAMRWKLDDVMGLNIEKLNKRYPDGFDKGHSLHRAKGDI